MSTPSEARPAPSTGLAFLAALLPLVFVVVACPLMTIALPGADDGARLTHAMQEAGIAVWLVFGATLIAVVALGVLLGLTAKGWRVPAVFAVGFAGLPWLCGLFAALWGTWEARAAIANADVEYRATMMARGIAEATTNSLFGAALSSALFAATGLAFAIGALAQQAPGRRGIGSLVGAGAMLPLVGVALYAISAVRITSALELVLATLGAVLAAALGGLALGADAPHGRSGALGAAACVASGLGVAAASGVAGASGTMAVFSALANADPSSRSALLLQAASEMAPVSIASIASLPLALMAAGVVAALAALRLRPKGGTVAGAVALVLLAAAFVGVDAIAGARGASLLTEAMSLTR